MTRICKTVLALTAIFFMSFYVNAENICVHNSDKAVTIDFPEGYYVAASADGGSSYQMQNRILPITLLIKSYPKGKFYKSPEEALKDNLSRLKAQSNQENFLWRRQKCSFASFKNNLGQNASGYGAAVELPYDEGIIVLITWAEQSQFEKCSDLMLSTLDSLTIDYGSDYEKGLVTQYLYPDSSEGNIDVTLNIDGMEIHTVLKNSDAEASQYLIEREDRLLAQYTVTPNIEEACKRYYRMIFRDSMGRMQRAAFDIYNALAPYCTDETDLAQKLLTWTQNFKYERDTTASDFVSLPSMLLGSGSDCDSRSMLLTVLLKSMNMEATLFISPQFSHALAGFVSNHPGHAFTESGKKYLIGETTKKGLTWGMMAQEQSDQSYWITIPLP